MNILFINTTDKGGGAADLTYSLKARLEKLGHTTSMFVKQKHSNDKNIFLIAKQNKLFQIASQLSNKITTKDVPNYIKNKIRSLLENDIAFFNNKNLLNSKEFKNADIIHCHNLHGGYFNLKLLQKISKIKPVIWTLHDMWAITPHEAWIIKDKNGIVKFSMELNPALKEKNRNNLFKKKKKIYNNSHLHIVATCRWFMDELDNSILRKKPKYLIHNGIDTNIFKPSSKKLAREKLNLPQSKKIITFMANAGKDNKQKGWFYAKKIIKNYSNNNDILFLCIGGEEKDDELPNKNVIYIKYIKDKEIFSLYHSASDIFLNPSLAEAFGLIITQAMACGTPVVTFPIGIVEEAIKHKKSGYIAKYQNTQDLINGIEYIFNLNKDELDKISGNSIQKVKENFTLNIMTNNYINLYKQILKDEQHNNNSNPLS